MPVFLLCCALLLGACAPGQPTSGEDMPPATPLVAFMVTHAPGDSATLDDPEAGQGVRVTLHEEFTAATGLVCRRATVLHPDANTAEMVVACREPGDAAAAAPASGGDPARWRLMPRVWGQGRE